MLTGREGKHLYMSIYIWLLSITFTSVWMTSPYQRNIWQWLLSITFSSVQMTSPHHIIICQWVLSIYHADWKGRETYLRVHIHISFYNSLPRDQRPTKPVNRPWQHADRCKAHQVSLWRHADQNEVVTDPNLLTLGPLLGGRVDRPPTRLTWQEGNVLFNDALNTFYLRLYGKKKVKFVLFNDATGTHWFLSYHRLLDVIHMVTLTHFFRRKPAAAT